MPIKIPNDLPAFKTMEEENIFVISDDRARHQDIRPLEIAIVNLMPKKIETETQILKLLSNTPIQVNIELVQMASHVSKNTPKKHLLSFYKSFDEIKENRYDGLIITGAPVEMLDFEDVDYWNELCDVFEWSKTHVFSTIHICWGAQAGLYYHYGLPKYTLDKKMFGIFPHKVLKPTHPLLNGFDDVFYVPHSRHTEVRKSDIKKVKDLTILTESDISGVHIVADKTDRQFFFTGHSEYERRTLLNEYQRDIKKGLDIEVPYNYFPDDNPKNKPEHKWFCHANLMFSNWLNYCVYQKTPFDLNDIEPIII